MVVPVKFDLDEYTSFLDATHSFDEEMMHKYLDSHLDDLGFPILIHNVDMLNQEDFADSRSRTFGASDSAVLLEVAYHSAKVPMKTINELIFEKVNKIWDEEIGKKASVRKGRELEPMLIDKVSERINGAVLKPKHTYWNGTALATNFDGVVFENVVKDAESPTATFVPVPMEIKVCSFFGRSNYSWDLGIKDADPYFEAKISKELRYPEVRTTDLVEYIRTKAKQIGIPPYYYTQVQQQMLFLGANHGYLAVMDDINWDMYYFRVPRDEEVIKALVARSEEYAEELTKYDDQI